MKNTTALAILEVLTGWDAPAAEAVIAAQVNAHLGKRILMADFDDALYLLDHHRHITGIHDPLHGTLWSITNKGRAARHS